MSLRWRIAALAVLVVVVAVGTTFVLTRRGAEQSQAVAAASAPASVPMSELAAGPRLVFRHTGLGADYGKAAAVSLGNSTGPRAFYNVACERLYAVPSRTVCLYRDAGLVTTYHGQVGDGSFANPAPLPLTGLPSRARLSADGSLVATTTFVSGDSYLSQGFRPARTSRPWRRGRACTSRTSLWWTRGSRSTRSTATTGASPSAPTTTRST